MTATLLDEGVVERLFARREVTESGCWVWIGADNGKGYGRIKIGGRSGRLRYVHIVAYEIWVGPVPVGCEVDHVAARGCRSRACFNPEHLEAVTHLVNLERGSRWGKPYCDHGHLLPPITERNSRGQRKGCAVCSHIRAQEKRACEVCGKTMHRPNLYRHQRAVHGVERKVA